MCPPRPGAPTLCSATHTPPRNHNPCCWPHTCFPRRQNIQPCSCPAPRPDSLQRPAPPDPPPATGPSPHTWGLAPSLLTSDGQPRAGTAGPTSASCSTPPIRTPGSPSSTSPHPSSRHTDPQPPVSPGVCLGWYPSHLQPGLCARPPSRPVLSCLHPSTSCPLASRALKLCHL